MKIGYKLKKIRKSKNKSIENVCNKTTLSKEYLYNLENDLTIDILLNKIQELADYYNIDISELIKKESNEINSNENKFNESQDAYYKLALRLKRHEIPIKKFKKMVDILIIKEKIGVFPPSI